MKKIDLNKKINPSTIAYVFTLEDDGSMTRRSLEDAIKAYGDQEYRAGLEDAAIRVEKYAEQISVVVSSVYLIEAAKHIRSLIALSEVRSK